MTTASIHPKVAAATVGAILSGAGFAIAAEVGANPSPNLIVSVTALVTFAIGWLVPEDMLQRMTRGTPAEPEEVPTTPAG